MNLFIVSIDKYHFMHIRLRVIIFFKDVFFRHQVIDELVLKSVVEVRGRTMLNFVCVTVSTYCSVSYSTECVSKSCFQQHLRNVKQNEFKLICSWSFGFQFGNEINASKPLYTKTCFIYLKYIMRASSENRCVCRM